MKKLAMTSLLLVWASSALVPQQTAPANPYFTGTGGKGKSIVIRAPKATGLAEDQTYLLALVQGELVSTFSGYSAFSVIDREQLEDQYAELLSGYYDDGASADLGHLNPDYSMTGSIIKTATGYALQMSITKIADKTAAASYSGTCTFAELDNLTGVRRASLDLPKKWASPLLLWRGRNSPEPRQ